MSRLSLCLLGGFRAELHGQPVTGFESNKVRALLAYLAVEAGRPHQRSALAGLLWPDQPEEAARTNLRHVLRQLRRTLDDHAGAALLIQADQQTIAFRGDDQVMLDVARLLTAREASTRCNHTSFETCPTCIARYREAAALYHGPFLAGLELPDSDLFGEWAVVQRERLHRQVLDILATLATCYEQQGDLALAREYAWRQLELEPWHEEAHRQVMRVLARSGQRAQALAHYETCRRILRQELGIEPGAETQALRDTIARGSPPSTKDAGPAPPLTTVGLPALAAPIGRDAEASQLRTLWENAASGRGRLVIIRGEAGVGKSHLVRYLTESVVQQGGLALVGHCYEFERALPYQAIVEMLRAAAHTLQHADLPLAYRAPLHRLAPDVLGLTSAPLPEVAVAEADMRAQLFEALLQTFLTLARQQPLLLLLEDTHWAAESTLDWLTYITPRLLHSRLLVAITYRTSEVGADHALARLRRRFARASAVTDLWVRPLSRAAHRALVAQLSGLAPPQADAVADRLFSETAGNPFFLEEIVRGLIETEQIYLHAGHWSGTFIAAAPSADVALPESLRETIQARLERLPEMSRGFICAAAVAGRVFDYDIVQHAGGWTDELALTALEDLLARGFVYETPEQGGFAFVHHLMQEAIYADLTPPRRRYLHRRLAEALQALRPQVVELAHHFALGGDQERARTYYLQAGDRAREVAALSEAVQHYRAALERWSEADRAGRAETLHRLGECQWLTGDIQGALQTFEAAYTLFAALGDRLKSGEVQRLIGLRQWDLADRTAAARHLHQALAILEQGPESVELASVMCSISGLHMMASEYEEAIAWGERALALAERLRAEGVTCYALVNIGSSWVSVHADDVERGMTMQREGLRRALALGLARDASRAYYELSEALTGQGRYAEARTVLEELRAYATRTYVRPSLGIAIARLTELDWLTGHWAEVLARRQELAAWLSVPWGIVTSILMGEMENDLGRPELARQELERTLPQAQAYGDLHRTASHLGQLARAYAGLGMAPEALAMLDRVNHLVDQRRYLERRSLPTLLFACQYYAARMMVGQREAAYQGVGRLERADRQLQTPETAVALAEGQGVVWLADERPGEAATRLRQAADQWRALDRPYAQARALRHLGQALAQLGQMDEARRSFDQALAIFDALVVQLGDDALQRSWRLSPLVRETHAAR
ncbi:MAG: tetratricopeptide repeat protein [Anaerolineae bacterium]|nr:tetratricopeptide repeat protein [Anaerolineae bacterium]